MMLLSCKAV